VSFETNVLLSASGVTELDLVEDVVRVGSTALSLLRPRDAEALLDEDAFAEDEFLPYWAELWPAGLALARALPERLDGLRVVEVGCGLGIPSLVATARSARVTATDWAPEAIDLLRVNAARNGLVVDVRVVDWRNLYGDFDLALAADVLYEYRNVDPLLAALPRLAPDALVALAGRPYEAEFLRRVDTEPVAERIVRIRRRA
jgi:predicted nicotinamide N-methyase